MAAVPGVAFVFQSMVSTANGSAVAIEAIARPSGRTLRQLLRAAADAGHLVQTDADLAAAAVGAAPSPLPLHVNVLAPTAASADILLATLVPAVRRAGRRFEDTVVEVGAPFTAVAPSALIAGLRRLRDHGFGIALDGIGDADLPFGLLADTTPDLIKTDAALTARLPGNDAALAVLDSLVQLAARVHTRLAVTGVQTPEQLTAVATAGVRLVQGRLLADPDARPLVAEALRGSVTETGPITTGAPTLAPHVHPALTLPDTATAEDVRALLADHPAAGGVVLLDEHERPSMTVDRNRFLLAVTGPYGHALNARRPATRHADHPRTVYVTANALTLLEMVRDAAWERTGDDVVVLDAAGRCVGVVRVHEVVRAMAEAEVERAAALNPLTRLPGSDLIGRDLDRRIRGAEMFAVTWIDVDAFKTVNDTAGFAEGDNLIRVLGAALTEAAETLPGSRVGHIGGDDFLAITGVDEIGRLAGKLLDTPWTAAGRPITLSLATLVCSAGSVLSFREVSRLLAPLKQRAKTVDGATWVLGRPGSDRVDVLRGGGRRRAAG